MATKHPDGYIRSKDNVTLVDNFLRYGADPLYSSKINSLSFARGTLYSYELGVARFWRGKEMGPTTLFLLERDGMSSTTSAHLALVRRFAGAKYIHIMLVPHLDMTYQEACQYALDKLTRIAQRWERSMNNNTLRLYLDKWKEAANHGVRVPPLSSRMHTVALLEGYLNG